MKITFYKYQGTGNDFILIDDTEGKFNELTKNQIEHLCSRKFGIGADGLILLQQEEGFDFKMKYFNSDGNESSMCGNGGRCIAQFANDMGIVSGKTSFIAIDGPHDAEIFSGLVKLKMKDVSDIIKIDDFFILNTGSPHYVQFVKDASSINVFFEGKKIRNSEPFKTEGINVNFVQPIDDSIKVRTYERGVENETYSCGTGVVASALVKVLNDFHNDGDFEIKVETIGGILSVNVTREGNSFKNVWLIGPAVFVYKGETSII
jgi:diaminopimelate epimerase